MNKVDLHIHTIASDGLFSPTEMIEKAVNAGLKTVAITDHDTVAGLKEASEYAKNNGIEFIPGVELSIDYEDGTYHLVGLFIDYNNEVLIQELNRLNKLRSSRAERIVEDLALHEIYIPFDDVIEEAKDGAVGRPHVARVLVKHGYARSLTEVFKKYLVKGKPGYVPKDKISAQDGINLIKNAGGISIIAHPTSLELSNIEDYEKFFVRQMSYGVDGIEAYSAMNNPKKVEQFLTIAKKHNLLISGGSDFHGDKNEVLGEYGDEREIPAYIVERMKSFID